MRTEDFNPDGNPNIETAIQIRLYPTKNNTVFWVGYQAVVREPLSTHSADSFDIALYIIMTME